MRYCIQYSEQANGYHTLYFNDKDDATEFFNNFFTGDNMRARRIGYLAFGTVKVEADGEEYFDPAFIWDDTGFRVLAI